MRILAIETSCDETSIALLEAAGTVRDPRFKVVHNLVASQIAVHAPFGGVVPNLAKREHLKNLPILYRQIFNDKFSIFNFKGSREPKIDLLAVTVGPGLEPALWTGITFAEEVYKKLKGENPKLKMIGVNHLEGHLYSFLLAKKTKISNSSFPISKLFPAVALIASGGHTILLHMTSLTRWQKLGETRDDAVGEAFDKAARLLKLPYPGGPEIERLAKKGDPKAVAFPRPMLHDRNFDFSFSGLKTALLYFLRDHGGERSTADVAASFQAAAVEVLVAKTERAARDYKAKSIMLSGGVAANTALRSALQVTSQKLKVNFFAPPMDLNTDNAATIGAAGYLASFRRKRLSLEAQGRLNI